MVGGVAERSRRRITWQRNRLIERAFPGHNATPRQNRDSSASKVIRSGYSAPSGSRMIRVWDRSNSNHLWVKA
jgi:hypothetical protein